MPTLPLSDCAFVAETIGCLSPDHEPLRMLISGGTGFFGRWFLEPALLACDRAGLRFTASVITRSIAAFEAAAPHVARHPCIRLIEGDVRSFSLPEHAFTHVVHLAASNRLADYATAPQEQIDVIVDGTRRMLSAARACGAKRFLYASSGAVYGRQPADIPRLREDCGRGPDPLAPMQAYGIAKSMAEHLCCQASRGGRLGAVIARGFAFAGPLFPLETHQAFGSLMADGLAGRTLQILGDGTARRSYLYGADLAMWLWTLLLQGKSNTAYNVGSEEEISVEELARLIGAHFGVRYSVVKAPDPSKPGDRYVPSTARARALGLRQNFSLEHAIVMAARHVRSAG